MICYLLSDKSSPLARENTVGMKLENWLQPTWKMNHNEVCNFSKPFILTSRLMNENQRSKRLVWPKGQCSRMLTEFTGCCEDKIPGYEHVEVRGQGLITTPSLASCVTLAKLLHFSECVKWGSQLFSTYLLSAWSGPVMYSNLKQWTKQAKIPTLRKNTDKRQRSWNYNVSQWYDEK